MAEHPFLKAILINILCGERKILPELRRRQTMRYFSYQKVFFYCQPHLVMLKWGCS